MLFRKRENIASYSDLALISRFQKTGDNIYVGELYKRYIHLVFGVSLKYLKSEEAAKDMAMQVFEKLLYKLTDQQVENFKSWLHVLTKNECLMQLRKQKTRGEDNPVELNGQAFMENEPVMHLNGEEALEEDLSKLEVCIGKLKNEQETCIRLFYLEKKSYQEIELITGFELKKVKSHVQNGRRNLKICVESLREQEA
ncbi:MAG: sigma-70 family RNA polymerase sigma factor [Roseivirga sp.]